MIAFSLLSTSLPEVEEPLQRERDRSKWNCGQNDDTDYLTSPSSPSPPPIDEWRKNWRKTDKTIRGKWNFQGRLLAIPRFTQLFVNLPYVRGSGFMKFSWISKLYVTRRKMIHHWVEESFTWSLEEYSS